MSPNSFKRYGQSTTSTICMTAHYLISNIQVKWIVQRKWIIIVSVLVNTVAKNKCCCFCCYYWQLSRAIDWLQWYNKSLKIRLYKEFMYRFLIYFPDLNIKYAFTPVWSTTITIIWHVQWAHSCPPISLAQCKPAMVQWTWLSGVMLTKSKNTYLVVWMNI